MPTHATCPLKNWQSFLRKVMFEDELAASTCRAGLTLNHIMCSVIGVFG